MNAPIIIVSGLPRSGTSLMMQMLYKGSIEVLTDEIRTADTDNPKGYFELEQVKKIKSDTSWLPSARGKCFKMVSQLLYELPSTEHYRIVFMDRELDEVLLSQEKMLQRLGRAVPNRDEMKQLLSGHLERLHRWLPKQTNLEVLRVSYNDLLENPAAQAQRVCDFLGGSLHLDDMVASVDPALYRNRKATAV